MTARVLVSTRVSATTERTFDAFVGDIGQWWRPSPLFPFTPGRSGRMVFEPGPEGRVVERYDDGTEFEIGRVQVWDPPSELVLSWRMSTFEPGQQTQLHVRFEPVDDAHAGHRGTPRVGHDPAGARRSSRLPAPRLPTAARRALATRPRRTGRRGTVERPEGLTTPGRPEIPGKP